MLISRDAAINFFFLSVLMYFMDVVIVMVIKDDFKVKITRNFRGRFLYQGQREQVKYRIK